MVDRKKDIYNSFYLFTCENLAQGLIKSKFKSHVMDMSRYVLRSLEHLIQLPKKGPIFLQDKTISSTITPTKIAILIFFEIHTTFKKELFVLLFASYTEKEK